MLENIPTSPNLKSDTPQVMAAVATAVAVAATAAAAPGAASPATAGRAAPAEYRDNTQ